MRRRPALWIALAAIVLGAAFRARVIALPTDTLVSRYLADDYFYYLAAADHVARGEGSTVDGITRTNGYQPLFLALLAALFRTGATRTGAIHAGLILQAIAAAAAALGVYACCARRGMPWTGALAAGLISLNLFFVLPTLTGFEMALALACLVWTVWAWDAGKPPRLTGLLAGLAVLARVDALILVAILAVDFARRTRYRAMACFLAWTVILAGPWFVWSIVRFGTAAPDSGAVKAHLRGPFDIAVTLATTFDTLPRVVIPGRVADLAAGGAGVWGPRMFSVLVLAAAVSQLRARRNHLPAAFVLALAGAYALAIDPRETGAVVRYLFPAWTAIAVLAGQHAWIRRPAVVVAILLVHALDLALYTRWERMAPRPATYVGVAATELPAAIARTVPAGDALAAFDSGALGYFSPRPVVNLDGLANHEIVDLRRRCRGVYRECLLDYLRARNIRYLAGSSAFGWVHLFPDFREWRELYRSRRLDDAAHLHLLEVPD